jgi:hypothetical protein
MSEQDLKLYVLATILNWSQEEQELNDDDDISLNDRYYENLESFINVLQGLRF